MSFISIVFLLLAVCTSILYVSFKAFVALFEFVKKQMRIAAEKNAEKLQKATMAKATLQAQQVLPVAPVEAKPAPALVLPERMLVAQPAHSVVTQIQSESSDVDQWSQYDSPAYLRSAAYLKKGNVAFC